METSVARPAVLPSAGAADAGNVHSGEGTGVHCAHVVDGSAGTVPNIRAAVNVMNPVIRFATFISAPFAFLQELG